MSTRTIITLHRTTARPTGASSLYDNGPGAVPGLGLARPAASLNVRTAVTVPEATDQQPPTQETLNRRVDLLVQERSNKRISEAEYQTGRIVQALFERSTGVRNGDGRSRTRGNPALEAEIRLIYGIDDGPTVARYLRRIPFVVGEVGTRRLRTILMGRSFQQVAEERGRPGERGLRSVADQFRSYLQDLTEAWAASGVPVSEQDPGKLAPRIMAWLAEPTPDMETERARGTMHPRA